MPILTGKVELTLKHVILLLADKNYEALDNLSKGVRLTANDIELAASDYSGTITMPPDSAFEDLDVIEIDNSNPIAWSVRFDLWTKEGGVSDLSLELTLISSNYELLNVEIDNLHVL